MTLQIRDGLAADIPACLALNADYETERVWQMTIPPEMLGQGVHFRTERLPRPMRVLYPASQRRLELALAPEHCFVVASVRLDDEPPFFGVASDAVAPDGTDFSEDGESESPPPVVVGVARQELLGYLTMRADPVHEAAWIQDLVVAEPYRREKIGTRLFRVATRWAMEHDLTQLIVETQTINHPAIQFCQKLGMTFCGYHDQYFRNGDIAIFFGKRL